MAGQVRGVSKHLVVDIGLTIQGEEEEELPEVNIFKLYYMMNIEYYITNF